MYFGLQRSDNANTQFKGKIDDISIFSNVSVSNENLAILSESHISEIYNNGYNIEDLLSYFSGSFTIPYYYTLNAGSGDATNQSSASNSTLQLKGGATWVTE